MMVLARHGRAVSPVTSYLAIEPGVRPSTEGLNEGELGSIGMAAAATAAAPAAWAAADRPARSIAKGSSARP